MTALRKIPASRLAPELCARINATAPGPDCWSVYQIKGTDQLLLFIHVGPLSMDWIREAYQQHVTSLVTVGAMQ
jgi:hypothetical protein